VRCFITATYNLICNRIAGPCPPSYIDDYVPILEEAAVEVGVKLNPARLRELAYVLGFRTGNFLHRTLPLGWLAEQKYNFKLWGEEWRYNQVLSAYAMGPVSHADKPKALSGAKIALGLQSMVTMHPRALEAMACGCLYLCNYLPHDYDDLGNYFIEGEDFVRFYGKEDFLRKVDYYLAHDAERVRIAENGRRKAVALSYVKLLPKWLEFIKSRIEMDDVK